MLKQRIATAVIMAAAFLAAVEFSVTPWSAMYMPVNSVARLGEHGEVCV